MKFRGINIAKDRKSLVVKARDKKYVGLGWMHLKYLVKPDGKINLRVLAQFPMEINRIYVVGFESVMMFTTIVIVHLF